MIFFVFQRSDSRETLPQVWPVCTMRLTWREYLQLHSVPNRWVPWGPTSTLPRGDVSLPQCEGELQSKCTPSRHSPVPRTSFTLSDQRWGSWQEALSASTHSGVRQEEALLWVLTEAECLQPMSPAPPEPPGPAQLPGRPSFRLTQTFSPVSSPLCQCSTEHERNTVSGRHDLPPQH